MLLEKELTRRILQCAYEVHSILGPGLFENIYEECLYLQLNKRGLYVERQKPIPVYFEELRHETGFRADLIVEKKVIIEIKAIEYIVERHKAQILTYLRFSECQVGLMLNFNSASLRDGIYRYANTKLLPSDSTPGEEQRF